MVRNGETTGSVLYKPKGGASGLAIVTVTVTDKKGSTIRRSFFASVTPSTSSPERKSGRSAASFGFIEDMTVAQQSTNDVIITGISTGGNLFIYVFFYSLLSFTPVFFPPLGSRDLSITASSSDADIVNGIKVSTTNYGVMWCIWRGVVVYSV